MLKRHSIKSGLFHKLRNYIEPNFLTLLKDYYSISSGVIEDQDHKVFDAFPITCGDKQGGILSPYLFNAFIHDLIDTCIKSNFVKPNKINISIIIYADGILLLSPHDEHLQKLLNICTDYSND